MFASVKYTEFKEFDSEHVFTYGVFGIMAEIISYLVGIIVCLIAPLELAIPIIITIFMIIKLVSIIFLIKADKTMPIKDEIITENKIANIEETV